MRLRNVKKAKEEIKTYSFVYDTPREFKGKWNEVFGNDNRVELEIGMGRGGFLLSRAKAHPDVNYIGIEIYESVLVKAARKIEKEGLNNIKLIRGDAVLLKDIFEKAEISQIYLNFSDPWPKKKHLKNRLTHVDFLYMYKEILQKDAFIDVKTDNLDFFEFGLDQIEQAGFEFIKKSYDLHSTDFEEKKFMTEYETKFNDKGQKINFVKIKNV